MYNAVKLTTAFAALSLLAGSAFAQTPPPAPPVHRSIFSKMFHPKAKPGMPQSGMTQSRQGLPAYSSMRTPMHPGTMQSHPTMGHSMMGHPMMGGNSIIGGQFVGNKNSHVYHMPGDKGAMPASQNRVYFRSAAEAEAAGYHVAGSAHGTSSHRPMTHASAPGMPMHH